MADNYLEKKMEQHHAGSGRIISKQKVSLVSLMEKSRGVNGYNSSYKVRIDQLRRIVAVNGKLFSSCKSPVLRFRLVTAEEAGNVLPCIAAGNIGNDVGLSLPGHEPNAFVVVCSTVETTPSVYVELGMSLQSMLLQTAEIGLNGMFLMSFDPAKLAEVLSLPYAPLALLAVGKRADATTENRFDVKDSSCNGSPIPDIAINELIIGQ